MNKIRTVTRQYFDFLNPGLHDYQVLDIATALSNICRYTGHLQEHYSVAQHSVHVSHLVPPRMALAGLMHDAAEAYLGDVSSPLKALLPDYKVIEKRVEECIASHFKIPHLCPLAAPIKVADRTMLEAEMAALQDFTPWLGPVLPFDIAPWPAKFARERFILRYNELTYRERNDV